ncbi:stimulated by retinoic acid gene 6 protein-like [Ptychodera flava]|uniref:stimulated by retinoic acid gene 6 protein-like n=1 Tax=Ptychodera flava TaxID=63121 RepID=UPI003969CEE4
MLDGFTDRLAYVCCFGFTSVCILDLFRGNYYFDVDYDCLDAPRAALGAVSTIMALINVMLVGYVFAPFFMCITTSAKILGNSLGLVYVTYWTYYYTYSYAECPRWVNDIQGSLLALPLTASYYYMFLRFFFGLIFSVHFWYVKIDVGGEKRPLHLQKRHRDYIYVKELLKKPEDQDESGKQTFKDKIKSLLYRNKPGFKYSRRILCTIFVCLLSLYQVNLQALLHGSEPLRYACHELFSDGGEAEEFLSSINRSEIFDEAALVTCLAYDTFRATANISAIIHAIYLIHMLAVYRRYMLKMYKGDRSFWPPELKSNIKLLVASLRFSGYQIAYILWGYMICQFLLWIAAFLLIYGFFLAIRDGRNSIVLFFVAEYWFTALVALIIYVMQLFTAKFVFLLDRGNGKAFGINNRRMFHVANYILFFFNVILGLFSCLLRIGKALIFGILFLGRTDKCLLMRGFESYDTDAAGTNRLTKANQSYRNIIGHLNKQRINTLLPSNTHRLLNLLMVAKWVFHTIQKETAVSGRLLCTYLAASSS